MKHQYFYNFKNSLFPSFYLFFIIFMNFCICAKLYFVFEFVFPLNYSPFINFLRNMAFCQESLCEMTKWNDYNLKTVGRVQRVNHSRSLWVANESAAKVYELADAKGLFHKVVVLYETSISKHDGALCSRWTHINELPAHMWRKYYLHL